MVSDNLILPMSRVHLPSLGTHLVVLRPVLLRSDTMEMSGALLITGAVQIHTLIQMVIDMKSINGKAGAVDYILRVGKALLKTPSDLSLKGTHGIIGDEDMNSVQLPSMECPIRYVVDIGISVAALESIQAK